MLIYEFSEENRGDLCGWGFVLLWSYREKGGLKVTKFSEASCLLWLFLPRHVQHLSNTCKLESGHSSSVNAYFDHRQCSKQHWKNRLFGSTIGWETMSHGSPYFLLSHTKRPLVSKDFLSEAAGFPSWGELLTLYFFSLLCHTALFSSLCSVTSF